MILLEIYFGVKLLSWIDVVKIFCNGFVNVLIDYFDLI